MKKEEGQIKKMNRLFSFFLLLTIFLSSFQIQQTFALPHTDDGYKEVWDGVDFEKIVEEKSGIYYGSIQHAEDVNIKNCNTGNDEKAFSITAEQNSVSEREENATPILWNVMGVEEDGNLTVLSKYVIDNRAFNFLSDRNGIGASHFGFSRIRRWLNMKSSDPYGRSTNGLDNGFDDGFLNSFIEAEYEGLKGVPGKTRLYDRFTGEEIIGTLPNAWNYGYFTSYGLEFPFELETFQYTKGFTTIDVEPKVYLPWGHGGGFNPPIGNDYEEDYPHYDSGKIYWNSDSISDDGYMIGEAKYKTTLATLKNGTSASYWLQSGNGYFIDGNPEDGHSMYPFYVTKDDGTVVTVYHAGYANGVRPIVKIDPERVLYAHEIVYNDTDDDNLKPGQLKEDKISGESSWNYALGEEESTNYKLAILDDSISKPGKLLDKNYDKLWDEGTFEVEDSNVIEIKRNSNLQYLAYKIVYHDGNGNRDIVAYGNNAASDTKILYVETTNNLTDGSAFEVGGDYTLYVWQQAENSDVSSFSCSEPYYFKLSVPERYNITYYDNDGDEVYTEKLTKGNSIKVMAPDHSNLNMESPVAKYEFSGWATTAEEVDGEELYLPDEKLEVSENIELYPRWSPPEYKVMYYRNYDSSDSTILQELKVTMGDGLTEPSSPRRSSYNFRGWFTDASCNIQWNFGNDVVVEELGLYAKWTKDTSWDTYPSDDYSGTSTVKPEPPKEKPEPPKEIIVEALEEPAVLETEIHNEYISGYPDGTVMPNNKITREEIAAIFFRLFDEDSKAKFLSADNDFSDVAVSRWSNISISTLYNARLLFGYPDGTFAPDKYITRGEFTSVVANFAGSDVPGEQHFPDISGHWAENFINKAAELGWISGYEDGTFRPDDYISRVEVICIVNKITDRCVNRQENLHEDMKFFTDNLDTSKYYFYDIQEAANSHDYERLDDGSEKWTKINNNK